MKQILKKVDKYLALFESTSVVVFLSVATILAFVEVVLRYVFFTSLPWSSEIVILCIIWAVFIGLSITFRKGGHIRVEVIVDLLSGKKKFTVVLVASLIGFIFAVVLFLYSAKYTAFLKDSGERSITTDIPEYIYFLALPVGGLLFSIRYLVEFLSLLGEKKKRPNMSN